MARVLAITNRTNLDVVDGWDDCYALWRPLAYGVALELSNLSDDITDKEAFEKSLDLVKRHIVGGKVRILNEEGESVLADLEADDVDVMPPKMVDRLLADITGVKYDADPLEGAQTATTSSPSTNENKLPESTSSTATPSYETSKSQ